MNILNKNIDKILIIIFLIVIYIFPSHLFDFIIALVLALFVHLLFQHSREYKILSYFRLPIEKYDEYMIKRKIDKILRRQGKLIKKQEQENFLQQLRNNAIRKIKSTDEGERQIGIEELVELEPKDIHTYDELMKILKNGSPKSHEKQILEILCKFYNSINE